MTQTFVCFYLMPIDDLIEKLQKQLEDLKADHSRKVKQIEHVSEEKDRKLRILEQKSNKMREKLLQLTNKDRSSTDKNAETLKNYHRGAEVVSSSSSVASVSSLHSRSSKRGGQPSSPGGGKGGSNVVHAEEVIHALEEEQKKLQLQNAELGQQVSSLTKRLKKSLNSNASLSTTKPEATSSTSSFKQAINKSSDEDFGDDVQLLSDKVKEQSQRIRQLVHQLEGETATVKKQSADMKILRQRGGEMREEIHNLRLEIDSRPTMSQWKSKVGLC